MSEVLKKVESPPQQRGQYVLTLSGEVFTLRLGFRELRLAESMMHQSAPKSLTDGILPFGDGAVLFFFATGGATPHARFASVDEAGEFLIQGGHFPEASQALTALIGSYFPPKADSQGNPT